MKFKLQIYSEGIFCCIGQWTTSTTKLLKLWVEVTSLVIKLKEDLYFGLLRSIDCDGRIFWCIYIVSLQYYSTEIWITCCQNLWTLYCLAYILWRLSMTHRPTGSTPLICGESRNTKTIIQNVILDIYYIFIYCLTLSQGACSPCALCGFFLPQSKDMSNMLHNNWQL